MKYIRFSLEQEEKYGIVEGNMINLLDKSFLLADCKETGETIPLDSVKLEAPVEPGKIVCVGVNYSKHAQEMNHDLPEDPIIFMKPPTSVLAPFAEIENPVISERVDYEAELAVVIGKTLKRASEEEALAGILGYTCANDVTARDLQQKDGQWTRGKSFDTFCPLGPWVVTGIVPWELDISLSLNGELKQSSNTRYMITNVAKLVSYISQVMTLKVGDVVLTGTPEGVGPMRSGDEVVVKIANIGELRNHLGQKK